MSGLCKRLKKRSEVLIRLRSFNALERLRECLFRRFLKRRFLKRTRAFQINRAPALLQKDQRLPQKGRVKPKLRRKTNKSLRTLTLCSRMMILRTRISIAPWKKTIKTIEEQPARIRPVKPPFGRRSEVNSVLGLILNSKRKRKSCFAEAHSSFIGSCRDSVSSPRVMREAAGIWSPRD